MIVLRNNFFSKKEDNLKNSVKGGATAAGLTVAGAGIYGAGKGYGLNRAILNGTDKLAKKGIISQDLNLKNLPKSHKKVLREVLMERGAKRSMKKSLVPAAVIGTGYGIYKYHKNKK